MLTGYTTSVEYKGVTYHVQTEDKGVDTPVIVSLVYNGGTVLASKRTPYGDLVAEGLDRDVLAKRVKQQHKVICAALLSGRLEDLKKLSEKEGARAKSQSSAKPATRGSKKLAVKIEKGIRFRAGEHRNLRVRVVSPKTEVPIKGAQVTVKLIGSSFRSLIFHARTEESGVADFHLQIPHFDSGRGAVVISAVNGEDEVELRRVLRPA